ncbi:hypothetical protein JW964_04285 [candidate division KSB1 bacterium]|nr:hypothetical protein [candidate division KSB1 bacterium]
MTIWLFILGLIILGFLLVVIEIFLIPGFNIFGVFGFISIAGGIILAYSKLPILYAHLILIGSLFFSSILIWLFTRSRAWKKLVLDTNESKEDGFSMQNSEYLALLNKSGVAYSMLRPSGIAIIEGKKYDVVTEGGFINKDEKIQVVEVSGNRIVVRQII